MADFSIRPAHPADGGFLADMVVEAANWRAGSTRPRPAILADARHGGYVAGWQRPADRGVVAVDPDGRSIGATWFRLFGADRPSMGFVAAGVPELIIGVRPIWRAQGVGRALLRALADRARLEGYARLALSVEHGNFAHELYRSEGFTVVASSGDRDTMVRALR
ncbi:GNAT superfamily N-acetyltransferase [Agromyces flavus]|uniref:Acetyltransferase (GNAT) family protein n=1 Tax=Agromyces flavus TaxID=589382 RepID=A0A1H1T349_9MICO|nr:GNAT family N-acetyltransferase [Agromyces flavus]MCP2369248.1 GNAT superfamily N-acetyltransferase [Agromyces flavus]SDS54416.1 Acetyltransferase (GNAT) family protein [Agromyces flavus]